MAAFLQKLIPQLAKAVATEEIPAAQRRKPAARRTTRTRSSRAGSRSTSRTTSRRTTARPASRSTRARSTAKSA